MLICGNCDKRNTITQDEVTICPSCGFNAEFRYHDVLTCDPGGKQYQDTVAICETCNAHFPEDDITVKFAHYCTECGKVEDYIDTKSLDYRADQEYERAKGF